MHIRMASLRCSGSLEYSRHGFREDLQVKPQRPSANVLQIEFHPLFEGDRTPSLNLPETGNSRANAEAPPLPVLAESIEQLVIAQLQRTRTDQAHVPLQYVEELWKLVNAGLTQKAAQRRNAWIVLDLENRPAHFVLVLDVFEALFRVHDHGAELVDVEHPFIEAHAFLYEEHRARGGQLHQDGG